MKKNHVYLILPIFTLLLTGSFVLAQAQTSSNPDNASDTDPEVEISMPINKDDFLLFYGTTQNVDANQKILILRKDFYDKFKALKANYKANFDAVVGDLTLTPADYVEKVVPDTEASVNQDIDSNGGTDDSNTKPNTLGAKVMTTFSASATNDNSTDTDSNEDTATGNNSPTSPIQTIRYIIKNTKDNVITPIANIVNNESTIKTKASSWFVKIKSWFGW